VPDAPDTSDDAPADETAEATPDEEGGELAKLRAEAARRRVEAREATERADELARRLTAAVVAAEAGSLLADPEDLARFTDEPLTDDDGYPDPAKVRAAAEALAEARPHLAARRFAPIDQGADSADPGGFDLAGALRSAAS
jgi:hypothetical protein